jgi:hypothetical protein
MAEMRFLDGPASDKTIKDVSVADIVLVKLVDGSIHGYRYDDTECRGMGRDDEQVRLYRHDDEVIGQWEQLFGSKDNAFCK